MMETIIEYFRELWEIDAARWVVYLTIIAIVATIGFYLGKLFRDMAVGTETEDVDHLSEFEKLKEEGKMGEFEYVRVRSQLDEDRKTRVKEMLDGEQVGSDDPDPTRNDLPDFRELNSSAESAPSASRAKEPQDPV